MVDDSEPANFCEFSRALAYKPVSVTLLFCLQLRSYYVTYVGVLFSPPTYDSACSYLGVVSSQVRGGDVRQDYAARFHSFISLNTHGNLLLGGRQDRKEIQELVTRTS